mgnify:CR=1 FL=1
MVTIKIILLTVFFFLNLFVIFSLCAAIINIPLKVLFGEINYRTGNKKVYWFGYLVFIFLLFYIWQEIAKSPPTFVLVLVLLFSSFLSLLLSKAKPLVPSKFYISKPEKVAFIVCLMFLYAVGLIFKKIDFILW